MQNPGDPHPRINPKKLERFWVPGSAILGVSVGLLAPLISSSGGISFSSMLGWTYFFMWSVSFYPQVVQNCYRRSVVGLSLDFQLLNFVGFLCYFVYNGALYWSKDVQREYENSPQYSGSLVQINDVVFAGHAALITLVTLTQIAIYWDYPPLEGIDRVVRIVVVGSTSGVLVISIVLAIFISLKGETNVLNWYEFVYLLSFVKVVISFVKYCPQVWMNFKRKSTDGWNIHNVLMDFSGGFLSVLQLWVDAKGDLSKAIGDPAKFLLGNLSMLFDIIFMVQHYCLYNGATQNADITNRVEPSTPLTTSDP